MQTVKVQALVAEVEVLDDPAGSLAALTAAGTALRSLRGWIDGREAILARRLAEVTSTPEQTLAQVSRCSPRDVDRIVRRAATAGAVPPFAEALADGAVRGEHVDVLANALKALEPSQRDGLVDQADRLVALARRTSPDEFRTTMHSEVRRLQAENGTSRLERQRRDTRLRTWIDRETGMWHVAGRFDPETGLRLHGRLGAMVASLFAESVPDTCPTDPGEKQDHLRALALVALTEGRGGAAGRPEIIVVVDTTHTTDDGTPRVDWGLPVDLPASVLVDLFPQALIHLVVLCNGAVIHAPGTLDLGRTTRIANRAQRRALRGWYPTCAVPGCSVRFDYLKIHHVHWWRHGGTTDLHNLLPVCQRHHHAIHDLQWQVVLQPDRTITITFPDGATMATGPPARNAA